MAGLALAPMATGVSKTCAKAAAIFPIAFLYHLTALASLPVQVALATARTIAGVKGRGVSTQLKSEIHENSRLKQDVSARVGPDFSIGCES